jgi:hypothetical protein
MKKITILFATFLLTQNVFGQQKIGNNPTTMNANAILELESTDKGLLIPRLALTATNNAAPLSAFVAGMMVYNTATTGDVTPGFYVSTGSSWSKIDNQTTTTLYNGNGTLSSNRTVTQGANTLAFTSTATNGFSVDGTTFSVDAANNRIGIRTTTPEEMMHFAVSTATNVIKAGPFGNANGALFIGAGGTSGVSNWIDFNNSDGVKSGNLYLDNTFGFGINNTGTNTTIGADGTKTGICTVNPKSTLDVNGGVSVRGNNIVTEQGVHIQWNKDCCDGATSILNHKGGGGGGIKFGDVNSSNVTTEWARFDGSGRFGIGNNNPQHPLHMGSGAHVTSAGTWTNASDLRLKNNISNSRYGLNDVLQLRAVDYTMKSNGEKQVGFIAQEVKKIIPEVVSGDENSETMMGISYGNLVPVLVNAIKEQQAQIEKMQKEIEELKKEKK